MHHEYFRSFLSLPKFSAIFVAVCGVVRAQLDPSSCLSTCKINLLKPINVTSMRRSGIATMEDEIHPRIVMVYQEGSLLQISVIRFAE